MFQYTIFSFRKYKQPFFFCRPVARFFFTETCNQWGNGPNQARRQSLWPGLGCLRLHFEEVDKKTRNQQQNVDILQNDWTCTILDGKQLLLSNQLFRLSNVHSKFVFCKASPTLPSLRARKKGNKFHGTCIMLVSLLSATPCKLIDNHSMEVAKTSVSSGNTV